MPATARRPPQKATPAKKAAAKKAAPAKKAATKRAPTRPDARQRSEVNPGTRGPAPLVLVGFTFTPSKPGKGTDPPEPGKAEWHTRAPAYRALVALARGHTWETGAARVPCHQATLRQWNDRGRQALGDHTTLDELSDSDPDLETLAYAAFHLLAQYARHERLDVALNAIARAAKGGEWRAGVALLKHLPQAEPFRPDPKRPGAGGSGDEDPEYDAREAGSMTMLDLALQYRDNPPKPDPA